MRRRRALYAVFINEHNRLVGLQRHFALLQKARSGRSEPSRTVILPDIFRSSQSSSGLDIAGHLHLITLRLDRRPALRRQHQLESVGIEVFKRDRAAALYFPSLALAVSSRTLTLRESNPPVTVIPLISTPRGTTFNLPSRN